MNAAYWDERARRFATRGAGLKAVCSYGMPAFHNLTIDWTQRLALRPWLADARGREVLDLGCGIGRWSRRLARLGARVTGVDVSPAMIEEARRRASDEGLSQHCAFQVADVSRLALGRRFERIFGVTVLQHLLNEAALEAALEAIAAHLGEGGRAILLEAAPARRNESCDTPVFRARSEARWRAAFARAGLEVVALSGVDPAPFRTWLLPRYAGLPAGLRLTALGLVTALSLPIDLALGRRLARASWHKLFVLEPSRSAR